MLATHHECGAPMFRYHGKVVCPVCDFQEKRQIIEPQETGKTEQKQMEQQKKSQSLQMSPQSVDISQINDIITNKIRELAASLENEAELERIKDKMECIEQGLKILKMLR